MLLIHGILLCSEYLSLVKKIYETNMEFLFLKEVCTIYVLDQICIESIHHAFGFLEKSHNLLEDK